MIEDFYRRARNGPQKVREVGGFHIENPLASTTDNVVYLAHTGNGASVAVKISKSPDESTTQVRQREIWIQNEAARVTTNVVPVVDSGREHLVFNGKNGHIEGNFFFSVTPFFVAGTLDRWIPELRDPNRNLTRKSLILNELREVSEATAAFGLTTDNSREGIVHRDIKPENVLLSKGQAYLTDFRTAIFTGEVENNYGETIYGTPSLMSPEQALGLTQKYDHRTDVWYLTELLLQILDKDALTHADLVNFQPSHEVLSSPSALKRHLKQRLGNIPFGFGEIIRAGLEYYPENRPATFLELFPALERAIENPDAPSIIYSSKKYG